MSCDNPTTSEKDDTMPGRPKFDKSKICVKCKENRGNVVVKHAVFCKACFFPFVTAKFKRSLDPFINEKADALRRKVLKASGNLLLGFSGGLGSTILLDLINQHYIAPVAVTVNGKPRGGKDHPRNDQVWRNVYVCYVETCAAFPENARDKTEDIRKVVEQYENAEFIPLRLEDAFDHDWWTRHGGNTRFPDAALDMSNEDLPLTSRSSIQSLPPSEALRLYLSSLPTQTAFATTIQTLIRRLLLQTAHSTGSSHLLLGTSLTSLSIAHISSIAQGGGFVVREEAQEEWTAAANTSLESKKIRVIRPLKDVGMKECGVWVWWRGLHVVGRDRHSSGKQGIGALTRDFIIGLEADYPSTVSTIARTCAKVEPKEESEGVCIMCGRPAQRDIEGWKSRISIREYTDPANLPPQVTTSLSARAAGTVPRTMDIHLETLTPHLCYMCHTTLVSKSSRGAPLMSGTSTIMDGLVPLPVWVNTQLSSLHEAAVESGRVVENGEVFKTEKMDEKAMRNALEGFLLSDD